MTLCLDDKNSTLPRLHMKETVEVNSQGAYDKHQQRGTTQSTMGHGNSASYKKDMHKAIRDILAILKMEYTRMANLSAHRDMHNKNSQRYLDNSGTAQNDTNKQLTVSYNHSSGH